MKRIFKALWIDYWITGGWFWRSREGWLDVDNLDILEGLVVLVGSHALNGVNNVHALGDAAKDGVLLVEKRRAHGGDEELAAVGVGTG